MGIRCSLLGHDFGETEVEREREEDGSEVVETVREVETCTRCGKEKLLTENTNVTSLGRTTGAETTDDTSANTDDSLETASESGDGGTPASSPTADDTASAEESATADESDDVTDDAEIIEETAAETDAAEQARTDTAEDVVAEAESAPATEEDDAVILDEDEEPDRDRKHGEWPEAEDTGADDDEMEPTAWPENEGEDEGYDAELGDETADVEFGGGLTPEAENVDIDGDETVGGDQPTTETSITSAGSAPSPDAPTDTESVDTEFVCPECGYSASATRSSLRSGDICPECRHGYITERER